MNDPRVRLRSFREERGWTQREVAEHIQRLAWVQHGDHVGANADMIAKWERGAKGVSPYYRDLLALLFGVDARRLGIGGDVRPVDVALQTKDIARSTMALLDQLGGGATAIRARIAGVLHDQVARHRALLDVMGVLTVFPDGPCTSLSSVVHEDLCDRLQDRYHSTTPIVLMTAASAHLDAVSTDLREARSPGERQRLARTRARCGTLVGRISFFDLDDGQAARGHYVLAAEMAREAGDVRQEAATLTHLAFVPAHEGNVRAALDYLDDARVALESRPHAVLTSWIEAVASEVHSNAGSPREALAALDRAKAAMDVVEEAPPRWFDYYDDIRLAGFAGYAYLIAGEYDAARRELEAALRLPLAAAKQRVVLLADLATTHYRAGDLDEACRVAVHAVDELAEAGYATGSERIRGFLRLVRPHATSPAVRHLNERVSSLK